MFSPLLDPLRTEVPPLRVPKGRPVRFPDAAAHHSAWTEDAELYALSAIAPHVTRAQQARALFVLLGSSWTDVSPERRAVLVRVVRVLLSSLPAGDVLTVMLALRRERSNHKHTSRALVGYLTEHPAAEALAASRRRIVRDVLEHAVGRNTLRAAAKTGSPIPYARDTVRSQALLAILYGEAPEARAGLASFVEAPLRDEASDAPKTVTATNRGDVSATLVHMYRGGVTADLQRAVDGYVEHAAAQLPAFEGSLAVVLDTSASMRGYGEREYCSIAQSLALTLVLAGVCKDLRVVRTGADESPLPVPSGSTDLARAVLDAAEASPDVIAVVTDGYENVFEGDLADVAAALPRAGIVTPIVVCQSKFTFKDDLALRRPAPALPEVAFWHEDDFGEVLFTLASHTKHASAFRRRALLARLARLEAAKG